MDAKDLHILRLMGVQPFSDWPRDADHLKPSHFARRLGMSVEAAKARVRRMEKDGVILGYELYPNFSHLGLLCVGYLFRLERPASARTMEDLAAVDGLGIVERYLGPAVGVDVFERSGPAMDRRVELVSRLVGATSHSRYASYPSAPVARAPSRLDWRIMLALRGRATRPLSEVAEELQVSPRTVTRRFDRLWAEGSVDTVVRLNTGNVPSLLFANTFVHFRQAPPATVTQMLHRELDSQWAYCWSPPDKEVANLVMGLVFRSPSHMQETLDRIRAMPNVADAEILLSAQSTSNEAWLTEAMQQAAQRSPDDPEALVVSRT